MFRYRWILSLVLSVGLLLGTIPQGLAQETTELSGLRPDAPEYGLRGPHWVGYEYLVIDAGTDDEMEADLWYPALNPEGATEDIAYEFTLQNLEWDGPAVTTGHALLGAPPDDSMGPYPLIIFSHGFSANPEWYSTLLEHYASHGFVVLAPEHVVENNWMENVSATAARPIDVKRALDYAEELTAPGGDLAGQIDMENVAVVGHSYGGYTALALGGAQFDMNSFAERCAVLEEDDPNTFLCLPLIGNEEALADGLGLDSVPEGLWPSFGDPRVTAIISMAGDSYIFDEAGLSKLTIPMMAIGGTADTGTPYDWGIKPSYDFASSNTKALVSFIGAEHVFAGNLCADMPFLTDSPAYGFVCLDPIWDKSRLLDLTDHFTTAFLLDTLKGDKDAHAALAPDVVSFLGVEYQAEGFTPAQPEEQLARRWLSHWDTVNGDLEGVDEILAEDFVSHNMPEGNREVMIADLAAFRDENPNTYFSVDGLVIAGDKVFLTNQMWHLPQDAQEGDRGEPVSPQFLLVLRIQDGKIAERWLYTPFEP